MDPAILKECFEQGFMGIEIPTEYPLSFPTFLLFFIFILSVSSTYFSNLLQYLCNFIDLKNVWRKWTFVYVKCDSYRGTC